MKHTPASCREEVVHGEHDTTCQDTVPAISLSTSSREREREREHAITHDSVHVYTCRHYIAIVSKSRQHSHKNK